MAFKSKTEDKKKQKKKGKKSSKKLDDVPEDLDNIPLPAENKSEKVTKKINRPPSPITLASKDGNLIKSPTRLPPRFKDRFARQPQKKDIKIEKKQKASDSKKSIKSSIKPPVTPPRHRTIPKSSSITSQKQNQEKFKNQINQARQIHRDVQNQEKIETHSSGSQVQTLEEPQSFSKVIQSDLLQKNAQELNLPLLDVSDLLKRPQELAWPWVKSPRRINLPSNLQIFWRAEASLYSGIALLEFYTKIYEKGEIHPDVYHKQLKAVLLEIIQLRFKLEKDNRFNWIQFVSNNSIDTLFPHTYEKLCRVEGSSDIDDVYDELTHRMDYQEVTKLPTKTADYVSNSIELMDLIRLQSIATIERLIPLLEDMRKILQQTASLFGEDYWVIKEINAWLKRLYQESAGVILPENELERLEMQVVRWLNDFRRELKNL